MKLSVLQENLLKALVRTGRTLSVKPQLPILSDVLLVAEEGRLVVTTTSLDLTETVWVGAKVEEQGGICVSSRLFTEFITTLPQETVALEEENGSLRVVCAKYEATIPAVNEKEFPRVALAKKSLKLRFSKDELVEALEQALFAASADEGRPLLTGVKMRKTDGKIVVAATDGYRLSVKHLKNNIDANLDVVVPARALAEIVKVAQEEKEATDLVLEQTEEGQLVSQIGDTLVYTRLIDGDYPSFEKIIPSTWTTRALFDKEAFVKAVKSTAIFARENANIIRLQLEDQKAIISANTPQAGENRVEIDVKTDGEGGSIAFNSRFLLEFFSNYKEDELLFEMTGALNPGVFKPVKDASYLHVIMPVRVQG